MGDLNRRRSCRIGRGQLGRGCVMVDHAGRSLGHCGCECKMLAGNSRLSDAARRFVVGVLRG
jgi:hypothetical protein